MPTLDLYKDRKHSVIKLSDGKEYKIPAEYTVEEVERLLELKIKQEEIEALPVEKGKKKEQLATFWANIFSQLEIIFQHYQPDIDESYLRKHVTHNEALEMIGFFQKYRTLAIEQIALDRAKEKSDPKKKTEKLASIELRDIRRLITFLVVNGFSLLHVRKLYLDELYDFHDHLFFVLEQTGKIKEGSYAKIKSRTGEGVPVEDTVNELRKQMFKAIGKK